MKKLVTLALAASVLTAGAFAEKNWEVEIQGKLKAFQATDVGGENTAKFFDSNMFDDDTKIGFSYDSEKFEAGLEITPVFFFADDTFEIGTTPDPVKAFTAIYGGVKFGEVAKVRLGIYEEHTEDIIDGFKLDDFIDNRKLGFLDDSLDDVAKEADLVNGIALADFYFGPAVVQCAFVADGYSKGSENKFGAQARLVLDFDTVGVSTNYQFVETTADKTEIDQLVSIYANLKVIKDLPVLVGFAYTNDSSVENSSVYSIELRCQRDFEVAAFGLHNNLTLRDKESILYDGLGVAVPVTEEVAVCAEISNTVDIKEDETKGLFTVEPYLAYSPEEDVTFKAGVKVDLNYSKDNSTVDVGIPLKIEVKF